MENYESFSIEESCEDYKFPAAFQDDNKDAVDCIMAFCGFRVLNDTDCSFLKAEFLKIKEDDDLKSLILEILKLWRKITDEDCPATDHDLNCFSQLMTSEKNKFQTAEDSSINSDSFFIKRLVIGFFLSISGELISLAELSNRLDI